MPGALFMCKALRPEFLRIFLRQNTWKFDGADKFQLFYSSLRSNISPSPHGCITSIYFRLNLGRREVKEAIAFFQKLDRRTEPRLLPSLSDLAVQFEVYNAIPWFGEWYPEDLWDRIELETMSEVLEAIYVRRAYIEGFKYPERQKRIKESMEDRDALPSARSVQVELARLNLR